MAVLKDLIVHGNSRFINAALFNSLAGNKISANEGVFNKLIATNLTAEQASITDLTATNAKIIGLLDVTKGELHTSKWTNANMSNIGGSFYISPTVNTTIASTNTPMSITFGGSANNRTIQVTGGSFATDAVKIYSNGATSTVTWSVGSHVMITGSVRGSTGIDYPLGTLTGYLTTAISSGGPSYLVANGFTVGEISSPALETIISEIGTNNITSYDLSISMFEIGPRNALKPVGIMMTSYGVDKSTYLDIYGGVNQKSEDSATGRTEPNLRIGYLGDLPVIRLSNNDSRTFQPTGWGIYTDNGYFKGTIVSNTGVIGNFTIANELYTGSNGGIGQGTNVYVSPGTTSTIDIAGSGVGTRTWAFTAGSNFGVTTNGALYSTEARIGNDKSYMHFVTHVDYAKTMDSSIVSGKQYYTYNAVNNTYNEVTNPSSANIDNYYEQITIGSLNIAGSTIQVGENNLETVINNKADNDIVSNIEEIINPSSWADSFWIYTETEDTFVNIEKTYYQLKYNLSIDTEVISGKTYYNQIIDGNQNISYNEVSNPSGNPHEQNWYEQSSLYESYIINIPGDVSEISPVGLKLYERNDWILFLTKDHEIPIDSDKKYYQYNYRSVSGETKQSEKIYYSRQTDSYGNIYYTESNIETEILPNNCYERKDSYTEYIFSETDPNPNPEFLGLYEHINNYNNNISSFLTSHLVIDSNGLSILDSNSKYQIALRNDGLYVIENGENIGEGVLVSKFGENIEFNSNRPQRIGNNDTYILFTPNNENSNLEIIANRITIGNTLVNEFVHSTNEQFIQNNKTLSQLESSIESNTKAITNYKGYINIDSEQGYIQVGQINSNAYVQIQGGDNAEVAIKVDGSNVISMDKQRLYAPSAVVTNLFMQREDINGYIGEIGWIMRSNGHLSLKIIK